MTEKYTLEHDRSLVDIKDDVLGVSDLSRRIASSIVHMTPNEGLVIGLYGAWGSGKTTFITFVKQAISEYKEENQPIVLNFNPWLFSGHEDLIQRYLIELSKILSPSSQRKNKLRERFLKSTESIATISEQLLVFAATLQGNPIVAGGVKAIGSLSKKAIAQLSKTPSLDFQKYNIENALKERNKKILVIIDDIDRLEGREILDIFRMVKSVADFPNVIYLLTFDKQQVTRVINDIQKADGAEYLEKIVQYDIDLPQPDPSAIMKIFGERVDPTIEAEGGKAWDKTRWAKIYHIYLHDRLQTPRQALRLSNSFNFAYPALKGEIDPVDFIATESLRMFNNDVFYEIRRNPHKFTEFGKNEYDGTKIDQSYYDSVLQLADEKDRDAIKSLLSLLFPCVDNTFSNSEGSVEEVHEWRAKARVCSSHHFGRYFSYSILSHQFSDAEISESLNLTENIENFEKLIIDYRELKSTQGKSRIPEYLERVLDLIKAGHADEYLSFIIRDFIILGDLIDREEDVDKASFMRIEPFLRILWIILSAMKRLAQKENVFEILKDSFQNTKSVHIPVMVLIELGSEHGKYRDKKPEKIRYGEKPYISLEDLKELEVIILSKLREAAKSDALLENNNLHSLLYRWRDITGNIDQPKAWVKKITKTDDGLKKILIRFSQTSITSSSEGTTEKIYIDINNMSNFLNTDKVCERVIKLLNNMDLEEKEKIF